MTEQLLLLLSVIGMSARLFAQTPPDADFVWVDAYGQGRFQAAEFRYEAEWKDMPQKAVIHLFADSRYHLIVNDKFVNFGPARFYPAHPQYDTYDILPYLTPGKNHIHVRVFSNGTDSYQLKRTPPGFIAWGEILSSKGDTFSLKTPGKWRCQRMTGYDPQSPKMSFALGPFEVYDARVDFNASNWHKPQKLEIPLPWGNLTPRTLPPLTQEPFFPLSQTGPYTLKTDEKIYSFRVKVPDENNEEFRLGRTLFGHTWIYSPQAQQVKAGIWWGEHFLNGAGPLPQTNAPENQPHRQEVIMNFHAGWNEFFVRRKSFWGTWDFFLAFPDSAGLILSLNKKSDDMLWFETAGPFSREEEERLQQLTIPFSADQLPGNLSAQWRPHHRKDDANNPAVDMAWRYFSQSLSPEPVKPVTLEAGKNMAMVYDFRYKKLGRIVVEYEAPEGTILDVGFTEDLLGEKPWMMKRAGLYMGARHIAREGVNRFETLRPYGLRYLQLNIRNHNRPVKITKVYVVNQIYPFEEKGSFECSDPLFNAIWQLGWRTLRVCAEDSYTDTPFRERGLYAGDMLPQMAITLAGSGDLRLVRQSLVLFQDMYADLFHPNTPRHPDEIGLLEDYPLLTLEALYWYVNHTGEWAFADSLYPRYVYLLQEILNRRTEDGRILNERVFIEWTQIQKTKVYNTAYHALLARCCLLMADMANHLGKKEDAETYQFLAAELTFSLQTHYWDEEKGMFRDGIAGDTAISHHYPISSAWPYIFGLTKEAQEDRFMPQMGKMLENIGNINRQRLATPYGSFYLFAALYRHGMAQEAETFMRKHWGPMIYKHDDTAWENFGDTGIGTLSHAWSGAPTFYLTTQVLGVDLGYPHPYSPDTVLIAPQTETVEWAKGDVPHPKGKIHVEWRVVGNQLWLSYEAPEGVICRVKPQGRLGEKTLFVNGNRENK
ncbi:MAG: alpha-L-rhamnosidase C-terminal domain-containing protein [Bacteroidia bacterium]|nr:alpha-L-rhamnosidase C-terminal domain-containing protein [Bacteroidia bacterium]